MTPQDLRFSVFKLAFSGKLVEQRVDEKVDDSTAFIIDEPPFDAPEKWKWNYIGKVCDLYTGDSIAENVKKAKYEGLEEGFDYIGTKDVTFEHGINYDNGVRIPFVNNFKRAYKDCVLMCIEGGSAGRKIAILDREVCFGNKLCMFKATSVYNKFLYYYLQSSNFKAIFSDNLSGIIGGVSIKKIKNILLPIPPLDEQKRIVNKIEEILPLIDKYEQAWKSLELLNNEMPLQLEKAIIQFAMKGKLTKQLPEDGNGLDLLKKISDKKKILIKEKKIDKDKKISPLNPDDYPFEIPQNWAWTKLQNILDKLVDGDHNPPAGTSFETEYWMLSSTNIGNGVIENLDKKRFLTKNVFDVENERTRASKGDIFFTSVGTLGRSCIYDGKGNFVFQRSVSVMHTLINNKFLKYWFDSPYFQTMVVRNATGTAQKGFYLNQLADSLVPIPPLVEQERIVARIEELLLLCRKLVK